MMMRHNKDFCFINMHHKPYVFTFLNILLNIVKRNKAKSCKIFSEIRNYFHVYNFVAKQKEQLAYHDYVLG